VTTEVPIMRQVQHWHFDVDPTEWYVPLLGIIVTPKVGIRKNRGSPRLLEWQGAIIS
jgi:hypothetical protein